MKCTVLIFVGVVLHLSVTYPVYNSSEEVVRSAFDDSEDPRLWEKSGKFQGDIVLTTEQEENLYSENVARNGVINSRLRWPNRRIPYVISSDFTANEQNWIRQVLEHDYARSCVRPIPRTNQADYVYITGKNTGCWSYVGRLGGRQDLNLQRNGCLYYPTVVHEFLHAAGFYHQQSATERDNFVTIQWGNIQSGAEHNFNKFASNVISSFGQRYDYGSVMHYGATAFSRNGQRTIVPKRNVAIGTATRLSGTDVTKLNRMYGC